MKLRTVTVTTVLSDTGRVWVGRAFEEAAGNSTIWALADGDWRVTERGFGSLDAALERIGKIIEEAA